MALKKKLSKAEFDALPSDFQKEYKASGENFVLDIEGDDGIDWKHKRDIAEEHRRTAEAKATKAQDDLDEMRRANIPKNDVEALEASWKQKLTDAQTSAKAKEDELNGVIANQTVGTVASDVASLFLAPAAMIPMIRGRLKVEINNGVAVTRVLDKNGQPSAMSVEDLKNEFKADTGLAPVLVGSKASGGGAAANQGGGGGAGKKLKEMNDQERIAFYKADPAEFKRQSEAQKTS